MYWNALVDKSLPRICYYQQNVAQHYYLLDTLGHSVKWFLNYIFAKCLEILMTGLFEIGKFLQKHSVLIFRATAHVLHLR